jgi:uncharacterized protein (TIGR01319 family)
VQRVLSVDIGSTWTKAALFDLGAAPPAVLGQAQTPTTQDDLSRGFQEVSRPLLGIPRGASMEECRGDARIFVSSSAKGGLAIAAIGIVPDLTVSAARMAAASAGGRIDSLCAYKVSETQIAELEASRPDIVLLCGGTDGGNESYVLHNARALACSRLEAAIIYAGNATVAGEVRRAFGKRSIRVVENLMPEVGKLTIEPARAAIREVFLQRIVEGKGLEKVAALCAADPKPTPLAVYELMEACTGWEDVLLIDMGGATTDVYSRCPCFHGEEGMVLRGLEEPHLMRTVEGDLGVRVGAHAAAACGRRSIQAGLEAASAMPWAGADAEARFGDWVRRAVERPEILPCSDEERAFDDLLAEACLFHALLRHAGSVEEVWTPGGRVRVQHGKDLRPVRLVVASGGLLAHQGSVAPLLRALEAARRHCGGARLLPESPEVRVDTRHLIPLLANLAAHYPCVATELAEMCLSPLHGGTECRHA